jgi:hypothetical protein
VKLVARWARNWYSNKQGPKLLTKKVRQRGSGPLKARGFRDVLDKWAAARLNRDGRLNAFQMSDTTRADGGSVQSQSHPAGLRFAGMPFSLQPPQSIAAIAAQVSLLPEHRPRRP